MQKQQPQQFQHQSFQQQPSEQEQSPIQQIQPSQINIGLDGEKEVLYNIKHIQNESATQNSEHIQNKETAQSEVSLADKKAWYFKPWDFIANKHPFCLIAIEFILDITSANTILLIAVKVFSWLGLGLWSLIILGVLIWVLVLYFLIMRFAQKVDELDKQGKFDIYKDIYNACLAVFTPILAIAYLFFDLSINAFNAFNK